MQTKNILALRSRHTERLALLKHDAHIASWCPRASWLYNYAEPPVHCSNLGRTRREGLPKEEVRQYNYTMFRTVQ